MKKIDNLKVKLRSRPYKGVLTEIAHEQGASLQSVWNAVHLYNNPRILVILKQKMQKRKREYENAIKELQTI